MFSSWPFIMRGHQKSLTLTLHWFLLEIAGFAKRFAFVSAHDALLITVKWTRAAQMGPTDTHVKFGGSSTLPHFNYRILWLSLQMDKIITSSDNFGDWPNNHNIQILSQANNHFAIYWVSSVWLLSREYQTQNHRLSFLPSFIVSRLQADQERACQEGDVYLYPSK